VGYTYIQWNIILLLKSNEIVIHAITWMNLEKITAATKKTNVRFYLHGVPGTVKLMEPESG
jgi:hypothetical protein